LLTAVVRQVLQTGLEVELADHLGYELHHPAGRGSGNSRNGSYPKTVTTDIGEVDLRVPRDRNGSFDPQTVPKHQRRLEGLAGNMISLYAKGMTTGDIQATWPRSTEPRSAARRSRRSPTGSSRRCWRGSTGHLTVLYAVLLIDAIVLTGGREPLDVVGLGENTALSTGPTPGMACTACQPWWVSRAPRTSESATVTRWS
jgi:transposase-like protein